MKTAVRPEEADIWFNIAAPGKRIMATVSFPQPSSPADGIIAVVLNYRAAAQCTALIAAMRGSRAPVPLILVDNASNDGSVERFRSELPDVHLIVAEHNLGFSAGCNLGIVEAVRRGASRVLLLNPDVTVHDDAIARMEEVMASDPAIGIVGPRLLETRAPGVTQSRGIRYARATGRMRHIGAGEADVPERAPRVGDVDGVSGCAMLIRREVFERVGLLTDAFFFGFEDLDFCLRAKAAGFRTVVAEAAVMSHEGSASIGRDSPRRIYFATRNHLLLAARHGAAVGYFVRVPGVLLFNLMFALFRSGIPRALALGACLRGARDHLAGRYGAGPSI